MNDGSTVDARACDVFMNNEKESSMQRQSWFYLALGAVAVLTIGAVTNQVAPPTPNLASAVSLDDSGIGFPDGTLQTTAFEGLFGAPSKVYQSSCSVTKATATSVGRCDLPDTIPAGKRLVIETVSAYGWADNYILGTAYLTHRISGGSSVRSGFPWLQQTSSISSRRFFGFNHFVHLYVDGPETLQFNVAGGGSTGTSNYSLNYSVSGYLVDVVPF